MIYREYTIKDYKVMYNPFTLDVVIVARIDSNDGLKIIECKKFLTKDGEVEAEYANIFTNPYSFEDCLVIKTKEGKVYRQEELTGIVTDTEI